MAGTLVCFHAHPDDEVIVTGGTIALAADAGHRVVLVFATRGELGEVADGMLAPSEQLADRRVIEAQRAADILGAARVEFLGYRDSGMADAPTNQHPDSFASADVDEAAARLADILRQEEAQVLTTYDERGGYGHPDHIQVHQVARRAAGLVRTPRLYAATMNRDHFVGVLNEMESQVPEGVDVPDPEAMEIGVPAAQITTTVDVATVIDRKRAAMAAHASQIPAESFFLAMPPDAFRRAFETEWYIRLDAAPTRPETWLF